MTWTLTQFMGTVIGLLALCSLPAVLFNWYTTRIPKGSLWVDYSGDIIQVQGIIFYRETAQELVWYRYLGKNHEGKTPRKWFHIEYRRVPKEDEPLYLLANV